MLSHRKKALPFWQQENKSSPYSLMTKAIRVFIQLNIFFSRVNVGVPKTPGVLTIQISGPHPRPTESKFPGCDHGNRYFLKIPRHPEAVGTRPLLAIIPEGFEHQDKDDRKKVLSRDLSGKGLMTAPVPWELTVRGLNQGRVGPDSRLTSCSRTVFLGAPMSVRPAAVTWVPGCPLPHGSKRVKLGRNKSNVAAWAAAS